MMRIKPYYVEYVLEKKSVNPTFARYRELICINFSQLSVH